MNRQKKHGGMVEYSFPLVFLKLISMALYPVYDIDGSCKLKIQSENWNPRHNWDICQLPEVTRIIATRSRSHAICIWMWSIPSLLGRQTWRYEVNVSWHVICICISHQSYYTRKVPMQCNFWYGLVHTILLKSQWVSSQPDWSIVSYCLETHSWIPFHLFHRYWAPPTKPCMCHPCSQALWLGCGCVSLLLQSKMPQARVISVWTDGMGHEVISWSNFWDAFTTHEIMD